MDRSPLSCVRHSAGLIEVFSPRLHKSVKKTHLCLLLISKCQNLNLKRSRTHSERLQGMLNGYRRKAVGKVFTQFILSVMASPFVSLIRMDFPREEGGEAYLPAITRQKLSVRIPSRLVR